MTGRTLLSSAGSRIGSKLLLLGHTASLSILLLACTSTTHENFVLQQAMITDFLTHRLVFQELAESALTDFHMTSITYDFLWSVNHVKWPRQHDVWGLSELRWEWYKQKFREAGIYEGVRRFEGSMGPVFLVVSAEGLTSAGRMKGFAYAPHTPINQVENFSKVENEGIYYVTIVDDWHIFLKVDF